MSSGKVLTMSAMSRRHLLSGVLGASASHLPPSIMQGSVRMPWSAPALMIFGYQGQPAYLPSPRARFIHSKLNA